MTSANKQRLMADMASNSAADLERLDYLLDHPKTAQWIFRVIADQHGGRPMWREMVDRSMAVEIDFRKAMALDLPARK